MRSDYYQYQHGSHQSPGFCPTSSTTLAWLSSPTGWQRVERATWGSLNNTKFKKDAFHRKAPPRCSVQSVRMYPHHIWVWSVGQSEHSSIVFLLQLSLFGEQLNESIADLSTPLQSLGVLRKLRNKQQELVQNLIYPSLVQQCQDRLIQYQSMRGVETYIGQGFLVLLCLWGKDYVTITRTTSYFKSNNTNNI